MRRAMTMKTSAGTEPEDDELDQISDQDPLFWLLLEIPEPNFLQGHSEDYDGPMTEADKEILMKNCNLFGQAWEMLVKQELNNFRYTHLKRVFAESGHKQAEAELEVEC